MKGGVFQHGTPGMQILCGSWPWTHKSQLSPSTPTVRTVPEVIPCLHLSNEDRYNTYWVYLKKKTIHISRTGIGLLVLTFVCSTIGPLHPVRIRLLILALKPRGDVTRSPKQGYQWPNKKDLRPPILKKNKPINRHLFVQPYLSPLTSAWGSIHTCDLLRDCNCDSYL